MPHEPSRHAAGLPALRWAVWWLASTAFFLLIYGSLGRGPVLTAMILGILVTSFTLRIGRLAGSHFAPGWGWAGRFFWRVPLDVLRESALVFMASLRMLRGQGVRGRFRTVPFDAAGDTPEDAARRALKVLETSISPNSFVIAVDCEKQRLLLHDFLTHLKKERPR